MLKNSRHKFKRAFVLIRIFNKASMSFVQSAQIEKLFREGDLVERNLQKPNATGLQSSLQKVPLSIPILVTWAISLIHQLLVFTGIRKTSGNRPQPVVAVTGCQSAGGRYQLGERVDQI
ncbi:MAG: hypothetical protein ABJU19_26805 [Roseobacter sp.]